MNAPESRGAHEGSSTIAETLFAALAQSVDGLKRIELHAVGGRHWNASEIDDALVSLEKARRIQRSKVATRGRPAEKWRLTSPEMPSTQSLTSRNSGPNKDAAPPNDWQAAWTRFRDRQRTKLGLEVQR